VIFAKYNWNDQVEEDEMSRACSTNGAKRNAYMFLVGKQEGKKPLGRPRRRWVDNIKIHSYIQEVAIPVLLTGQ
jgi:hypothetical protein